MKSTPSPRVRLLAVLALILLAGAGAYVLIHGSGPASSTAGTQTTLQKTTPSTRMTTTTKAKAKAPESKKAARKTPIEGVNALDAALVAHPIVVVSVYARGVATDEQAMSEARAGAARVGAGFVAFNVFDEKIARQLAALVGAEGTSSPEVLFVKRGRKVAFTLQGFADSQVVAQAANNVFPHTEPWVRDANAICGRFSAPLSTALGKGKIADLLTATGRAQAEAALDEAATLLTRETKSLSAVRADLSSAKDLAQLVADLRQVATNFRSEATALRGNDTTTAQTIDQKTATLIANTGALAATLQLTSCGS